LQIRLTVKQSPKRNTIYAIVTVTQQITNELATYLTLLGKKKDKKNYLIITTLNTLRLLRTFAGVLGEKIRMRAILKDNMANYLSLESLINVDFRKKYKLPVSSIPQKKIAINGENDHVSFN